jgi:hypothetical protein
MDIQLGGTTVDLVTRSHRYVGRIDTHGYRMADVMNDNTSSILEMEDVLVISQGLRPAELRAPHLLLRKQEVIAVLLAGDHEAPIRRSNNRVERRRHGAMIMMPGLMLSGIIHLPARITAEAFFTPNSLLPSFLALTNVTIHNSTFNLVEQSYDVVIVRREYMDATELSGELVAQ